MMCIKNAGNDCRQGKTIKDKEEDRSEKLQ